MAPKYRFWDVFFSHHTDRCWWSQPKYVSKSAFTKLNHHLVYDLFGRPVQEHDAEPRHPGVHGVLLRLHGGTSISHFTPRPVFQNGVQAKSGFETCFWPQHLGCWVGAGAKTRLVSRIKKFTPHCVCRPRTAASASMAAQARAWLPSCRRTSAARAPGPPPAL
jgi:hypothetical protein